LPSVPPTFVAFQQNSWTDVWSACRFLPACVHIYVCLSVCVYVHILVPGVSQSVYLCVCTYVCRNTIVFLSVYVVTLFLNVCMMEDS